MRKKIIRLSLVAVATAASLASSAGAGGGGACEPTATFSCKSTIAFTSTRDAPPGTPTPILLAAEIYLIDADGTNPRRLTENSDGDAFPVLSPDGKKIVFDSNRNRLDSEPLNTSDLFVMNTDGTDQRWLTRGSSATWSADGKNIAFHASASGSGTPIRTDPGSATSDSDIFVANVDDLLAGIEAPTNVTNSETMIDDDPDWSPDGQSIVFTTHPVTDTANPSNQAELYLMSPDGSGLQRLTFNGEEERAPSWSPDASRIVYSCRVGGGTNPFRLCVMNADGSDVRQLTNEGDAISDLTASWSPDGTQIVFHRRVPPDGQQLLVINADGTAPSCAKPLVFLPGPACPLTAPPGVNNLAHWGELRVKK